MLDKARTKSFIPCWHHFKIGWNYSLYKGNRNYPFSSSMYLSSSFWLCSASPEQWTHAGQACASLARGNGCYSFSTWTSPSFPQLFDCHWPYTSGVLLKCILPLSSGKCCTYALRYPERASAGPFMNEDTGRWDHSLHLSSATCILIRKLDGSFGLWLHSFFIRACAFCSQLCVWVSQARIGWWLLLTSYDCTSCHI